MEFYRLNLIIMEEKQKYDQLEKENANKDQIEDTAEIAKKYEELSKVLTHKLQEIETLSDKNSFLSSKCEVLTTNLLEEQGKLLNLNSTHQNCMDTIATLTKDSERLRQHLLEMEETHTQEMLYSEEKQKDLTHKLFEIEQRERDNSTVYTSVSIRANQQVETLHKQIQLANQQRDEYQAMLSEAEDKQMKQVAALTNLQCVLEQFQKGKVPPGPAELDLPRPGKFFRHFAFSRKYSSTQLYTSIFRSTLRINSVRLKLTNERIVPS